MYVCIYMYNTCFSVITYVKVGSESGNHIVYDSVHIKIDLSLEKLSFR